MSSDELKSTISKISNLIESKPSNDRKPGKWEINIIGNFLLNLYQRSILTLQNDWCLKKCELRQEYLQFVTAEQRQLIKQLYGTDDVGTLLRRCGFLINTVLDKPTYRINSKALFDFRINKLTELDNMRLKSEKGDLEIVITTPTKSSQYQGSIIQKRVNDLNPADTNCYMCQEDYLTMESLEEHIQTHGENSNLEFLKKICKLKCPMFIMSYRLCKNSHNFCFEFESHLKDLIIEKIIIVQSCSFIYVDEKRVPYEFPENGVKRFFVDSQLFTRNVEQPIVLICHFKDSKDFRIIEQHLFMRSEEFPEDATPVPLNPDRLPNTALFKAKFELADYYPSKEIRDALKDDFYYEKLMKTSNEFRDYVCNGKNLQPETIGASLSMLLQIEDMEIISQYPSLKQDNVKIQKHKDQYSFKLKPQKGIFMKNVLSAYDEIVLTTHSKNFKNAEEELQLMMENESDMEKNFVGVIENVKEERIYFQCDKEIDVNRSYTAIFEPSRLNFRYQYRSLRLLSTNMSFLKKFLFPAEITPMPLSTITLDLYNKSLNAEQLQAVRNIAEGPRNDATYIIFGPPGTGKTTTLVEAIMQILNKPNTKILVTASSNSACDEVASKLCKYLNPLNIKRAMVRIYSRSSKARTDTIDKELLENSNMYNRRHFYPDIGILHEYRVVICTLSIVGKLATGNFGSTLLYTHLFIDEVAASMETEALMAITTVLKSESCLIISGDNKQLGPVLQSKRAKELGLDVSLMDRLLARDCYRVDVDTSDYDRSIQTRLVRNYRSHPEIVNLYSGLYYNHSLEAVAKPENVSLCEIWHKSLNKQYPIMFHATYEPSTFDKQSRSLYNLKELEVVMDYVKDFMYFGINGEPINESDIGIISPYKNQYKRIKKELKLRKWCNIETGSVEIFQGKEKSIIIVSFARSGTRNLGFLDCPRRLNVTLSRAKSILILIGNPKTLSLNTEFEYIIKECQRNNTFVDSNGPAKEVVNQLNKKMQGLSIESVNQENHHHTNKNRKRGYGRQRTTDMQKSTKKCWQIISLNSMTKISPKIVITDNEEIDSSELAKEDNSHKNNSVTEISPKMVIIDNEGTASSELAKEDNSHKNNSIDSSRLAKEENSHKNNSMTEISPKMVVIDNEGIASSELTTEDNSHANISMTERSPKMVITDNEGIDSSELAKEDNSHKNNSVTEISPKMVIIDNEGIDSSELAKEDNSHKNNSVTEISPKMVIIDNEGTASSELAKEDNSHKNNSIDSSRLAKEENSHTNNSIDSSPLAKKDNSHKNNSMTEISPKMVVINNEGIASREHAKEDNSLKNNSMTEISPKIVITDNEGNASSELSKEDNSHKNNSMTEISPKMVITDNGGIDLSELAKEDNSHANNSMIEISPKMVITDNEGIDLSELAKEDNSHKNNSMTEISPKMVITDNEGIDSNELAKEDNSHANNLMTKISPKMVITDNEGIASSELAKEDNSHANNLMTKISPKMVIVDNEGIASSELAKEDNSHKNNSMTEISPKMVITDNEGIDSNELAKEDNSHANNLMTKISPKMVITDNEGIASSELAKEDNSHANNLMTKISPKMVITDNEGIASSELAKEDNSHKNNSMTEILPKMVIIDNEGIDSNELAKEDNSHANNSMTEISPKMVITDNEGIDSNELAKEDNSHKNNSIDSSPVAKEDNSHKNNSMTEISPKMVITDNEAIDSSELAKEDNSHTNNSIDSSPLAKEDNSHKNNSMTEISPKMVITDNEGIDSNELAKEDNSHANNLMTKISPKMVIVDNEGIASSELAKEDNSHKNNSMTEISLQMVISDNQEIDSGAL